MGLLLGGLLLGGLAVAAPGNGEPARQVRCQDGEYAIAVRGYYSGNGTATVTSRNVHLNATVYPPAGGDAVVLDVLLNSNGPYVTGTGNLQGGAVSVYGRLDAPKASRLVLTYQGASRPNEPIGFRSGRIAGSLPSDVGDEGWDDEQRRD